MEAKHLARAWMLSALALIPVAAGIGWWSGRASITSSSEPADAPSAVPDAVPDTVVTTSSPGSRASLATAGQPLPDLSAPLRTILPELKRRADGGEPGAACRLAAEMELCEDIRRRLDEAATNLNLQGSWGGPLSAKQQDMRRNMQQREAERSERLLQESTHCEGVPAFSSRERVHYWRSAAMGGSLAAINYYVMGRPFRPENTLADLDALQQFQHEAATIAERGVASGDIQTTIALAEAYSPLADAAACSVRPSHRTPASRWRSGSRLNPCSTSHRQAAARRGICLRPGSPSSKKPWTPPPCASHVNRRRLIGVRRRHLPW